MHSKASFSKITLYIYISMVVLACQLCSCSRKQVAYFQGNFDTTRYTNLQMKEPVIQKNDILSILVFSDDPVAVIPYNQATTNIINTPIGYLVDDQGDIMMQGIGRMHVEGLTKIGVGKLLDDSLQNKALKNPHYNIRFVNFKITVQGEVNRSGEFSIPSERVTILEALALAGDATIYGKRDDILIIREQDGKRNMARVNTIDPSIFNSPYYYLKQNDMVIVEPVKRKPTADRQETIQNIGLAASLISIAAVIYSILKK
jgi:polysaccharide export outer membrane protein